MSSDPKRTKILLDRTFDRKKKKHDSCHEINQHRRWSAESGTSNKDNHVHLPRLNPPWPPQSDYNAYVERGKLNLVPPHKKKEVFTSKPHKKDTSKSSHQLNHQTCHALQTVPIFYNHQLQNSTSTMTYPTGVYQLPIYMSYAPVLPPIQNPGGNSFGKFQSKRFLTPDDAAAIIQKYFRGWKARKVSMQLQFISKQFQAKAFLEEFIANVLEEDIIPDVLIEILSHKSSMLHNPLHSMSMIVCSDVLEEDVSYFIDIIAASEFYQNKALINLKRDDLLLKLCQDLIDEVVNDMAQDTAKAIIKELVQNHLSFSKSADWLQDLIIETIQPMIHHVAAISHDSYKYEEALDDIIDDVTTGMMIPLIHETLENIVSKNREKETSVIAKFAKGRYLDDLFTEHLLEHLSGTFLSLYFNSLKEHFKDGIICKVLLHQCMMVDDCSQNTLVNRTLQHYHQKTVVDMALDTILDELCANLDEDILDLKEKEESLKNT